ncbi:heat shock protein DnaJ [Trypanosoma grayi]|uniref:heat shock protein DnaJ n=1 Tax=Trypanosoma grayi TaxID=71804 RepID=UPI0004F4B7E4|nr:heat shock protein DnaJ [Trypanosoma grayi]KEG10729.1 heat shock protein DnaJ [Trypanosoma grayi]
MFSFSDDMNEVFNDFLTGGAGGFRREGRLRKPKEETCTLPVTLRDLYNGKVIKVPRKHTIACVSCEGYGMKNKSSSACPACRGSGTRMMMHQMGMMMQQVTMTCDVCGGSGRLIRAVDACPVCRGKRTKEIKSSLTVRVEPGMGHREEIVLRGEGDFDLDTHACGDIYVLLEETNDDLFVRDGDDLYITKNITLAESLCGFQFVFEHLDGKDLIVRRERGDITKPGETKVVVGKGMPLYKRPGQFGDLIIKFNVEFPPRVEQFQIDLLQRALPPPKSVEPETCEDAQECHVVREELGHLRRELEGDAPEEKEGPSVGCAAQ